MVNYPYSVGCQDNKPDKALTVENNELTKAATRISSPILSSALVNSPTTSCPTYLP